MGDAAPAIRAHGASVTAVNCGRSKVIVSMPVTAPGQHPFGGGPPLPPVTHDRVCSWFDELKRVTADLPSFTPAARGALRTVLESLRRESEPNLTLAQTRTLDDVLAALSRR